MQLFTLLELEYSYCLDVSDLKVMKEADNFALKSFYIKHEFMVSLGKSNPLGRVNVEFS